MWSKPFVVWIPNVLFIIKTLVLFLWKGKVVTIRENLGSCADCEVIIMLPIHFYSFTEYLFCRRATRWSLSQVLQTQLIVWSNNWRRYKSNATVLNYAPSNVLKSKSYSYCCENVQQTTNTTTMSRVYYSEAA